MREKGTSCQAGQSCERDSAPLVWHQSIPPQDGLGPAGALLDHIGSFINPLRLVSRIPEGMVIDRLRDRLVTIVADFRSQTALRTCCSNLLRKDCVLLAQVPPSSFFLLALCCLPPPYAHAITHGATSAEIPRNRSHGLELALACARSKPALTPAVRGLRITQHSGPALKSCFGCFDHPMPSKCRPT